MYKKNEGLSTLQWIGFVAVLAGMMCFGSGCGPLLNENGFDIHGRIGIRSVDDHTETERTYRPAKSKWCYVFPSRCAPQVQQDEANGS